MRLVKGINKNNFSLNEQVRKFMKNISILEYKTCVKVSWEEFLTIKTNFVQNDLKEEKMYTDPVHKSRQNAGQFNR